MIRLVNFPIFSVSDENFVGQIPRFFGWSNLHGQRNKPSHETPEVDMMQSSSEVGRRIPDGGSYIA